MNKYFSLPGYFCHGDILIRFLNYYYQKQEYFYPDRKIDSLYDCPPGLIWAGGRTDLNIPSLPVEKLISIYRQFNDLHLRHTFTNCLLNEEMTLDYRCNFFVRNYVDENDKIIINSPILVKWFQDVYPELDLIYSTTLNLTDTKQINEITKDHIYVLNYNYNNNNSYIKKLIHPENIEMLCAETCVTNCPNRQKHYESVSKNILGIQTDAWQNYCPAIKKYKSLTLLDVQQMSHAITNTRINELSNMGIKYFKIAGRHVPPLILLEILLYYLVLPEYIEKVRQEIYGLITSIQFTI